MLSPRQFAEKDAIVTVRLMEGKTLIGALKEFKPLAASVSVQRQKRDPSGRNVEMATRIPTMHVAFVAFHREPLDKPEQDDFELREFNVQTRDGQKFQIMAEAEAVQSEVGFYALPVSTYSPFSEFFFFTQGLMHRAHLTTAQEIKLTEEAPTEEQLPEDVEDSIELEGFDESDGEGSVRTYVDGKPVPPAEDKAKERRRDGRPMLLGEMLVEDGICTQEDVDRALEEQKNVPGRAVGQILVEWGLADEIDIARILAEKFQMPFVDLDKSEIHPDAIGEVPTQLLERYRIFPFQMDETTICIALSDPAGVEALKMLEFSVGKRIHQYVAAQGQIESFIDPYIQAADAEAVLAEEDAQLEEGDQDATVKIVNRIILDAYRMNASDIHIEPDGPEEPVKIRFRVDGQCRVYREMEAAMRSQLSARVKIMSNLDIAEHRKPQDGKIKFKFGNKAIELRVAIVPTGEGNEDVVMRILAAGEPIPMDKLGFSQRNAEAVRNAVKMPYGLILAVGPTGSGKTTTLHSLLGAINTPERKIWTAEDPIEITQKGLRQVQVNANIGFNFAAAMRSFLRADPDIIMVGEMRDHETAAMGVEASLTGHLVFSTLHTNSAPETITRLLDMEIDPFSFSDALLAVVAQRLARRLCSKCKESFPAEEHERDELQRYYGDIDLAEAIESEEMQMWRAPGCRHCEEKGYKGRLGIHEVLVNSVEISQAILHKAAVHDIRMLALKEGMRTLLQDGIRKSLSGDTDTSQILSVCGS